MAPIFVSYSRKDNQPHAAGVDGWVSDFRTALVAEMMHVNCSADAWMDVRDIPGNRTFDDVIRLALKACRAFIIVYSENWIGSEHCQQELDEFLKIKGNRNSGRIFLVRKGEVSRDKTPKDLDRLNGYCFHHSDPPKIELAINTHPESKFRHRLRCLADDIKLVIGAVAAPAAPAASRPLKRPRVLLARASPDLLFNYEELFRELKTRGYDVSELTTHRESAEVIEEEWCSKLADVDATIHLVGAVEDPLDGPASGHPATLSELQFQLSDDLGSRLRIAWMPTELPDAAPERAESAVRIREAVREPGDRLFQGLWAETKGEIFATLDSGADLAGHEAPRLYLVYSSEDKAAALRLATYLAERQVRFEPSLLDGDPNARFEDHRDKLGLSRGILIYWGNATDTWFYQKIRDIRKYALPPPPGPRRGRAGCFADPESDQKRIIEASVRDDLDIYLSYARDDFDHLGDFIGDFCRTGDA